LRILALRIKIPGVEVAVRPQMPELRTVIQADASRELPSDRVTAYDEEHLFVYARLLDAEAAGMSNAAMIDQFLDLGQEARDGQSILAEHLSRARWMRETGYRILLSTDGPSR
jgi:hypothetical protein